MIDHQEIAHPSDTVLIKGEDYELTRRLKATLLQYVKLYERWSEDRQEWTKKLAEVEESYLRFDSAVNKFDEVDKNFRSSLKTFIVTESKYTANTVKVSLQEVSDEVKHSIYEAAKLAKEEIRDAAMAEMKKTVNDLNYAVDKAKNRLDDAISAYNQEISGQFWRTAMVATLASVVSGALMLLILFKVMPKPVLPISDQQLEYLHTGQSLSVIWPRLTKPEKDRLRKLVVDVNQLSEM